MQDIARFIAAFERCQETYFAEEGEIFEQFVRGPSRDALLHDDPDLNAFATVRSSQQAAAGVGA